MICLEVEVLAKKFDRFGWEKDRGTAVHDRLMADWMDALQDYPLDEVQQAFRECVKSSPRRMPNEGDVLHVIRGIRNAKAQRFKAQHPARPEPERERCSAEAANDILRASGFSPKRFGANDTQQEVNQ